MFELDDLSGLYCSKKKKRATFQRFWNLSVEMWILGVKA